VAIIVAIAVQPYRAFKFQSFAQFNQSLASEPGIPEQQEIRLPVA
jgi:hypothetical protein